MPLLGLPMLLIARNIILALAGYVPPSKSWIFLNVLILRRRRLSLYLQKDGLMAVVVG